MNIMNLKPYKIKIYYWIRIYIFIYILKKSKTLFKWFLLLFIKYVLWVYIFLNLYDLFYNFLKFI